MCLAGDSLKKLKVSQSTCQSKLQIRHTPKMRKSKDSKRHDMQIT